MSNHYTKFCFEYPLPDAAATEAAIALAQRGSRIHQEEEPAGNFPEHLRKELDCWVFDVEVADHSPNTIVVFSEEGGVDAAAAFIQHLLRQHDPSGRFGFEWCHDADRLTEDAHGGGAVVITADSIAVMNTGSWLHRKLKRILTIHRLDLHLKIDRSLDRDKEVHRLMEKIDDLLHRELSDHDAALIAHHDEIEIEEHQ